MGVPVLTTRRRANLAGFLACAGLMAFAYYAEYVLHLAPCNMCILQRVCVVALGVAFLVATLHNPQRTGARAYGALIAIVAALGAAVSARHVWMQMQPVGSLGSCGADIATLLDMMPAYDVVKRILKGGAECQAITWSLLGLSMPVWLFIALSGLGLGGLAANLGLPRESGGARG